MALLGGWLCILFGAFSTVGVVFGDSGGCFWWGAIAVGDLAVDFVLVFWLVWF